MFPGEPCGAPEEQEHPPTDLLKLLDLRAQAAVPLQLCQLLDLGIAGRVLLQPPQLILQALQLL